MTSDEMGYLNALKGRRTSLDHFNVVEKKREREREREQLSFPPQR